ncbi:Uncharacterized protein TCM_035094 isoform 1 [Theobroma cacao]|uniref:Uncharacterized protein isoform 1 n=1 Tax=Theobroma cacao TaxID=3641 RepID=A0A061FGT2_THECC|nr:Uncharacterized protein TCM_035094 isoform 1 [Theobroma cacao]
MAEEVDDSLAPETDAKEAVEPTAASEDIESRITTAMRSRVGHFKEQAEYTHSLSGSCSLTFEGVRRLLEKDLGLETFALDVHKRFVKQCLLKCLDGGDDDDAPKSSGETGEKNLSTTTEVTESPKGRQSKKDVKEAFSEDEEKLEDSPVLGLLTGHKTTKTETMETETKENKDVFESTIKKAIKKRASYVEANSEKVTMAGLRRLLEEDLKLDKDTLDPYKKFITEQLDEVLKSREVSAPASVVKKNNLKKNSQSKASKKASKKLSSASSGSESDEEEGEEEEDEDEDEDVDEEEEEEEEEVKPKKKISAKGKIKNSEGLKKRKIPKKEAEMPSKKRSKHAESISDDNSDAEDSGSVSDDNRSRSSAAKAVKRKETSTPVYGKHVEHLKSVIKSCGMSVPPAIYKRVKQVPENNREAQLIKELEEILSKEGLSSNPSEKGQDSNLYTTVDGHVVTDPPIQLLPLDLRVHLHERGSRSQSYHPPQDLESQGVVVTFRIFHSDSHWFLTLLGLHSLGQVINHSLHLCQLSLLGLISSTSTSASTNDSLLAKNLCRIVGLFALIPFDVTGRKRKERAKELEGIDTSNIVLSSRRRSTTSFVAPPKPKIPDASDDDESEESDDNDDDDDDDEDNDDEDGGDEGNSQSEGSDEGIGDSNLSLCSTLGIYDCSTGHVKGL